MTGFHHPSTGAPRRAFFLFAHHDDELFIAATMRRFVAAGAEVSALWLTRGGLGGSRREAESRRAAALLGFDERKLYFLRLPDGGVLPRLGQVVPRLERLLKQLRPDCLFVPAYEGGHSDHDAAQLAAVAALARCKLETICYEFPLYRRGRFAPLKLTSLLPAFTPVEYQPLSWQDRLLKRRLARLYWSQRLLLTPLLALGGGPLLMQWRGEPCRQLPPERDYSRRPYDGRLLYECFTRRRFTEFAAVARQYGLGEWGLS